MSFYTYSNQKIIFQVNLKPESNSTHFNPIFYCINPYFNELVKENSVIIFQILILTFMLKDKHILYSYLYLNI